MGRATQWPGPRLTWLVDRHLRPGIGAVQAGFVDAQREGLAPTGDPVHLAYLLAGSTAIFSQAAEVQLLTGRDPLAPDQVEAYADLVLRVLLPGAGAEQPADLGNGAGNQKTRRR